MGLKGYFEGIDMGRDMGKEDVDVAVFNIYLARFCLK